MAQYDNRAAAYFLGDVLVECPTRQRAKRKHGIKRGNRRWNRRRQAGQIMAELDMMDQPSWMGWTDADYAIQAEWDEDEYIVGCPRHMWNDYDAMQAHLHREWLDDIEDRIERMKDASGFYGY